MSRRSLAAWAVLAAAALFGTSATTRALLVPDAPPTAVADLRLLIGAAGLVAFVWSLRNGQYDDVKGASHRILSDDDLPK